MPMPVVPLNAAQANQLLKEFTTWMVHSAPADWEQLFLTYRSVGDYVELTGQVITVVGSARSWTPPDGAVGFFADLRDGMAKPGEGAWTTLRYHLAHPGGYSAEYDWDGEPDWDHVPPAEFFRQERERYPRTGEHAGWLLARG
ncbi:hypothetical protein [Amycolatopsis sp. 195334CR]|uniref:hypothetical protein n=1 Tax=Amycolatopsis sp. 195334CR TaxID=2814588 RepID=UPI001A8F1449|nr:hypothetical protein [Amycolatopsis sp. 195334CR]MBN6035677.1 hypothetical protein [Amycolatopsis sp. 195334CR]